MDRTQLLAVSVFLALAFAVGYFFGSGTVGFAIFDYTFEGELDVVFSSNPDFASTTQKLFTNDTAYFSVLTKIPQNETYAVKISGPNRSETMASKPSNRTFQTFWFRPEEEGVWEVNVTYNNRTFSETLLVSERGVRQSTMSKTQDISANEFAWFFETIRVENDFPEIEYDLGIRGLNISVYDSGRNLISNSSAIIAQKGESTLFAEYYREPPTTLEITDIPGKRIIVGNPENYSGFRIMTEFDCEKPRLFSSIELTGSVAHKFSYGNGSAQWVAFSEDEFALVCDGMPDALFRGRIRVGEPVRWTRAVSGSNPMVSISEGASNITIRRIDGLEKVDVTGRAADSLGNLTILDSGNFEVEYFTEGPQKTESRISRFKKTITIHAPDALNYTNVESFTSIEEVTGNPESIRLYWISESGKKEHPFTASDTNNNGLIDIIEWTTPHLSNQTFEAVVEITGAERLDSERNFISDIYSEVIKQDNVWSEKIYASEYVRVFFASNLTFENEITVYARNEQGLDTRVEIYYFNSPEKIAESPAITNEGYYKIPLLGMDGSHDKFDLRIANYDSGQAYLEFDHIIDPVAYYDPNSNVATNWADGTGTGYTMIDDGTRYPTAPSTSGDYLASDSGDLVVSEFGFANITQPNIDYITLWVHTSTGSNAVYTYYLQQAGTTRCSQPITTGTAAGWTSCNWTSPSGDLSQMTVELGGCDRSGGGPKTLCSVFAAYIEIGYTVDYPQFADFSANASLIGPSEIAKFNLTSTDASQGIHTVLGNIGGTNYSFSSGAGDEWHYSWECTTSGTYYFSSVWANDTLGYSNSTAISGVSVECDATEPFVSITSISPNPANHSLDNADVNWTASDDNIAASFANVTYPNGTLLGEYSGNFTLTTEQLVDIGNYLITVWANDTLGNSNTTSENLTVDDVTEPFVAIASISPNPANHSLDNADVNWTASDYFLNVSFANVTYPNGTLLGKYSGNFTLTTEQLADIGNYLITVWANDTSGNSNMTSLNLTVNDVSGPSIILANPQNESFSNKTQVSFYYNVSDFSEIKNCTVDINDGETRQGNQSAVSKTETNNFTVALSEGDYSWFVECLDKFDNLNYSETRFITIDNSSPALEYILPTPGNNDFLDTQELVVNVSHNESNPDLMWLYINGTFNQSRGYEAGIGKFTNFTLILSDGVWNFSIFANDSAQNSNTLPTRSVVIDTINPQIDYISPTPMNVTNQTQGVLVANVSHYEKNPGTIIIYLDGYPNKTQAYSGEYSNFTVSGLAEGEHAYYVWLNDSSSNSNQTGTQVIRIDSTSPSLALESPENEHNSSTVSITFYYSTNDATSGVRNCSLYIDGAWNQTNSTVEEGVSQNFHADLGNGPHNWSIICYDWAGNYNQSETRNITVDTTFPAISNEQTNGTDFGVNTFICLNATATDTHSGIFKVSAEINPPSSSPINLTLSNAPGGCGNAGGSTYSAEYQMSEEGEYNWTRTYAEDWAGNRNSTATGLGWNSTSEIFIDIEMTQPISDIELNESDSGANYSYLHSCNVTCEPGSTEDCTDVTIFAQYFNSGQWMSINTSTSLLAADIDNRSCGLLPVGQSCNQTFSITSGTSSGGNSFKIRCMGESGNAPNDYSLNYSLYVNDHPFASFSYPANASWLNEIESLNASSSTDDQGISSYSFELDNNTLFDSPSLLCESSQHNCTFNTSSQSECDQDSLDCFIRLNVTDSDGLKNSTFITAGIDNSEPSVFLDEPQDNLWMDSSLVDLRYTATDYNIEACSLYHNSTGTFSLNQTNFTVYSGVQDLMTLTFGDGAYLWNVICNDSAGNSAFNSTNFTFHVDTLHPQVQYAGGMESNDSYKNRNWIFVNVSLEELNFKNITFALFNMTGEVNSTTYASEVSEINFTGLYSNTSYFFNATVFDNAGNKNSTQTYKITLDSINPKINFTTGTEMNNTYFSRDWVFVNVTAYDKNEANITFHIFNLTGEVDSQTFSNSSRAKNFTGLNPDSLYFYNATIVDRASNKNSTGTRWITLDNMAPVVLLGQPEDNALTSESAIAFNYTPIDNNLKNCSLFGNFTGSFSENQTDTSPSNGTENSFSPITLADGYYIWNVKCHDSAGNSAFNSTNYTLDIDATPPSGFALSSPENSTESKDATPLLEWEQTSEAHFRNYTILVDTTQAFASPDFTYKTTNSVSNTTFQVTVPWDANTKYYWKVVAYDWLNQSTESSEIFEYTTDNSAPAVTSVHPQDSDKYDHNYIEFTYNVTDTNSIKNCSLVVDSAVKSFSDSIEKGKNQTLSTSLSKGEHYWNVTCYDYAGNSHSSDARMVNVTQDVTAGNFMLFWDGENPPVGWTCVSCNPGEPFYDLFPMGNSSYGATGGNTNHSHEITLVSVADPSSSTLRRSGTVQAPTGTHDHGITSASVSNTSNIPLFKNLKLISYNYGIPETIPSGAIAIFNSSPPSGWDAYSDANGRYIKAAGNTSVGGSAAHNHTVSYALTATTQTSGIKTGGTNIASSAHTHSVSDNSANANNQPPYLSVILAKAQSDAEIPDMDKGMIAMFNSTPPENWDVVSGSGEDFNGRLLLGSATYGTKLGSESHAHSSLTSTSTQPVGTVTADENQASVVVAAASHTHQSQVSFSTNDSLPPYKEILFAYALDTHAPNITLEYPENSGFENNRTINFTFVPVSNDGYANCSLWTNESSWSLKQTLIPVANNTYNGINETFSLDGTYLWNIQCHDNHGLANFSLENRTVNIDTVLPSVELNNPVEGYKAGLGDVLFEYTPSDDSEKFSNCSLYLNEQFNQSNSTIVLDSQINNFTVSGMNPGVYNWTVECYDLAGSRNYSETRNFTLVSLGNPTLSVLSEDLKIGKSNPDDNATVQCSVSCSGGTCNGLQIGLQYYDTSWEYVTDDSNLLTNNLNPKDCGTASLCSDTWEIFGRVNETFPLRCAASATTPSEAKFSSTENLEIFTGILSIESWNPYEYPHNISIFDSFNISSVVRCTSPESAKAGCGNITVSARTNQTSSSPSDIISSSTDLELVLGGAVQDFGANFSESDGGYYEVTFQDIEVNMTAGGLLGGTPRLFDFWVNSSDSDVPELDSVDRKVLGRTGQATIQVQNASAYPNGEFSVFYNITCSSYRCLDLKLWPRYNLSSASADTLAPATPEPDSYNVTSQPIRTLYLEAGQTLENQNFSAHAYNNSGYWRIDILANSTYADTQENDSLDANLQILEEYISLVLENVPICFGSQYAGTEVSASDGSIPECGEDARGFPVNASISSSVYSSIWVKGTGNLSDGKGHEIDLKYLRFGNSSAPQSKTNLTTEYKLFEGSIPPGENIFKHIYWWLFVPLAQPAGGPYTTNVDILVNKTS